MTTRRLPTADKLIQKGARDEMRANIRDMVQVLDQWSDEQQRGLPVDLDDIAKLLQDSMNNIEELIGMLGQ